MPATSENLPRFMILCNTLNKKLPTASYTVTKNVGTGEYTSILTLLDGTIRTAIAKKPSGLWLIKITDASFWQVDLKYMIEAINDCLLKMIDDEDVTAITLIYL